MNRTHPAHSPACGRNLVGVSRTVFQESHVLDEQISPPSPLDLPLQLVITGHVWLFNVNLKLNEIKNAVLDCVSHMASAQEPRVASGHHTGWRRWRISSSIIAECSTGQHCLRSASRGGSLKGTEINREGRF